MDFERLNGDIKEMRRRNRGLGLAVGVLAANADGGQAQTVEGGGLDHGVVDHVPEDNSVTDLKLTVERPVAHEIARET